MEDKNKYRGVFPVVGVTLLVAIVVILSGTVAYFVFDLGTDSLDGTSVSDVAVKKSFTENSSPKYTIISGEPDSLDILVDNAVDQTLSEESPSVGDSTVISGVPAGSRVTVLVTSGGESGLLIHSLFAQVRH